MPEWVTISLPSDPDGFISRKCPACAKIFKARLTGGSVPTLKHCPYCGGRGERWLTDEQGAYVEAVGRQFAGKVVGKRLGEMAREFNRGLPRGGLITARASHRPSLGRRTPPVPVEADGAWSTSRSACCGEPVKHDGSTAVLHCIACGIRGRGKN